MLLFTQETPDYSRQLEEIVKAMNRPTTPVWRVAVFSAFVGLVFGIVAQFLVMLITDLYRRYKMRRVLYCDLAGMFWAVENIMAVTDVPEDDRWRWQRAQLTKALLFRGEKYCLDTPELYMQLPERYAGEMLYPYFHQILDDDKWLNVNTSLALSAFSHVVHSGTLKPMYLRLFLGRKEAGDLRRSAELRYTQNQERLKGVGVPDGIESKPDEDSRT
jgi:hypothetical protein